MWCNMLTSLGDVSIRTQIYMWCTYIHTQSHGGSFAHLCAYGSTYGRVCTYVVCTCMYIYLCIRRQKRTLTWVHPHMTDWVHAWVSVMCLGVCMWVKIVRLGGSLGGLRWEVYTGGCLCTSVFVCVRSCTSTYRRGVDLVRPISTKS